MNEENDNLDQESGKKPDVCRTCAMFYTTVLINVIGSKILLAWMKIHG